MLAPVPVRADDGSSLARETYRRGKIAYDSGEYARAARAFAEADTLSPNEAVLEIGIAAAVRADDAALGMELVVRAERRGMTATASAARARFESRVGQTVIVEDPVVSIDPARAPEVHVRPPVDLNIDRGAGAAPPIAPAPIRLVPSYDPPSSAWFWGGLATTAVLGAATVASGVDAIGIHDRFESDRSNNDLADRGGDAQLRTNALLVASALTALGTATIAYFVFRPSPERQHARR